MKRFILSFVAMMMVTVSCFGQEKFSIWPNDIALMEKDANGAPTLLLYQPENKTTDACLVVFPGGGYHKLAARNEGELLAQNFNRRGMTVVVVLYRVPRRPNVEKHRAGWQDAQRAIRFIRSHAKEWKINPEKIGVMGFSAGGHLTLMTATTSQTPAYEPVDDLDKTVSCHVNFAVPVYPSYVLEDGVDSTNKNRGVDSKMVNDFAFDAKTPPMCFIHGDKDPYSSMGSIAVYSKLKSMNIPAELHIYAKVGHGFGGLPKNNYIGDWTNRVYEWLKAIGIVEK